MLVSRLIRPATRQNSTPEGLGEAYLHSPTGISLPLVAVIGRYAWFSSLGLDSLNVRCPTQTVFVPQPISFLSLGRCGHHREDECPHFDPGKSPTDCRPEKAVMELLYEKFRPIGSSLQLMLVGGVADARQSYLGFSTYQVFSFIHGQQRRRKCIMASSLTYSFAFRFKSSRLPPPARYHSRSIQ